MKSVRPEHENIEKFENPNYSNDIRGNQHRNLPNRKHKSWGVENDRNNNESRIPCNQEVGLSELNVSGPVIGQCSMVDSYFPWMANGKTTRSFLLESISVVDKLQTKLKL